MKSKWIGSMFINNSTVKVQSPWRQSSIFISIPRRNRSVRHICVYVRYIYLTDFSARNQLKPNNERRTRGSHDFKILMPREKEKQF